MKSFFKKEKYLLNESGFHKLGIDDVVNRLNEQPVYQPLIYIFLGVKGQMI